MEDTIQKIKCPLCENRTEKWGNKNSCNLYKCSSCKLIFVYPALDTSSVYTEDYFSGAEQGFGYVDYDADKSPMIPTFNAYLDLCAKYGKKSGILFDIGAATGFFLNIAQARGFAVSGVEISKFAADKARQSGLTVHEGSIKDANLEDNSLDVVTMFDVIEHMPEPFSEIKEVYRVLKPGGLVVINTPNGESFLARLLKTGWHLVVPPEHLYYFSPRNLGRYLSENGFSALYSKAVGKRFTISYIFETLYKWQGLKIWRRLANFFSHHSRAKWYLPINLHDNFILIARKNEK